MDYNPNEPAKHAGRGEAVRPRLIDEVDFLTLSYVEVVPEKDEIDFLRKNSDVKNTWHKLYFANGLKPYLLVFSPLNKTYDKEFSLNKGLDTCRKWLCDYWGIKQGFGTTERIDCAKVHHNFIVWHHDLKALMDKYPNKDVDKECIIVKNKWSVHLTTINYLTSAYEYITKECKVREFIKYKDYISFSKWSQMEKEAFKAEYKAKAIKVSKQQHANLV